MAKTRRAYTGASVSSTTSSAIAASGTTSFTVSAATNWPYGSDPFYVVLSPGTASEEKVLVTRTNTGDTTINIASDAVRGLDGTSAVSHDSGATVYPVFTAVDADEANELASMWESKGDIVSHGASTFARLAVGSDDTVLIADSSAGSGLAWGQVGTANIAADAITNAKIATGAVDTAELAADAVTNAKIADDSIDSEHYVDGSIDTAHLADDAVTAAKIATNAVTADAIAAGAVGSSELASTTVVAGTYGDADSVGTFTVDADGRITSASNTDIAIAQSAVSGLATALSSKLDASSYTATDVLNKIKTVDGSGSGLDADTLDGVSSGSFLRSDASDSFTGSTLTLSNANLRFSRSGVYSVDLAVSNSSNANRGLITFFSGSNQQDVQVADLFYGGALNNNSSITLKENVNDFTGATEILDQLRPVSFEYIKDDDDRTHVGLIAEEVRDVFPLAIGGDPDCPTINQSSILGLAIAGLCEANARISALEARIAELESN